MTRRKIIVEVIHGQDMKFSTNKHCNDTLVKVVVDVSGDLSGSLYCEGGTSEMYWGYADKVTYSGLAALAESLGYVDGALFYFQPYSRNTQTPLRLLVDNDAVTMMLKEYGRTNRIILFFVPTTNDIGEQVVDGVTPCLERLRPAIWSDINLSCGDLSGSSGAATSYEVSGGDHIPPWVRESIRSVVPFDNQYGWACVLGDKLAGICKTYRVPITRKTSLAYRGSHGNDRAEIVNTGSGCAGGSCIERKYFNPLMDLGKQPQSGVFYGNAQEFRNSLVYWQIRTGYHVSVRRANHSRVTATCRKQPCVFRVYGSVHGSSKLFLCRYVRPTHSCGPRHFCDEEVSKSLLCSRFSSDMRQNNAWVSSCLGSQISADYGMDVSRWKVYRTVTNNTSYCKKRSVAEFERIWDYRDTILKYIPGSVLNIDDQRVPGHDLTIFRRLYFRLGQQKAAYRFVEGRPVGVSGKRIGGTTPGFLITACARDGNDGVLPIATAIVMEGLVADWEWFFTELIRDYDVDGKCPMTFITPFDPVIISALSTVCPRKEHRISLDDLFTAFAGLFTRVELKDLFWNMAFATTLADYEHERKVMETVGGNDDPLTWLEDIGRTRWALSAFEDKSKSAEQFNVVCRHWLRYIEGAVWLNGINLLEWVRLELTEKFNSRFSEVTNYASKLCPQANVVLDERIASSRDCHVTRESNCLFSVSDNGILHNVDIGEQVCSCRMWQLHGVPCKHGMACIFRRNMHPSDFVADMHTSATYLAMYGEEIRPIPEIDRWCESGKGRVLHPSHWKLIQLEKLEAAGTTGAGRQRTPGADAEHKAILTRAYPTSRAV